MSESYKIYNVILHTNQTGISHSMVGIGRDENEAGVHVDPRRYINKLKEFPA
jgi:hypothetical protein